LTSPICLAVRRPTVFYCFFCLVILRRPTSTLFPYTTLFRSAWSAGVPPAPAGRLGRQQDNDRARRPIIAGETPALQRTALGPARSEEHTSELQSLRHLVCRLLLEKKKKMIIKEARYVSIRYT